MSQFLSKEDYWEARAEQAEQALSEIARYFTSGNEVPVERATIKASDFWRISGIKPDA